MEPPNKKKGTPLFYSAACPYKRATPVAPLAVIDASTAVPVESLFRSSAKILEYSPSKAHKLFSVNYLLCILKSIEPEFYSVGVQNIISEAEIRANDPVGGYYRLVLDMELLVVLLEAELEYFHCCIQFVDLY